MTIEQLPNRRRVLATLAGVGMAGVAGCFGSDDDDNEGENGTEENGDEADDGAEGTADDEEVDSPEQVLETYIEAAGNREVSTLSELHHDDGPLAGSSQQDLSGIELESHSVESEEDDQLIFEVTVGRNGQSESLLVELRSDDDWFVWDTAFEDPEAPDTDPVEVIEELFESLEAGDEETASSILRDGSELESLFLGNLEEIEGDIQLDDVSVGYQDEIEAEVEVTYTVPSAGETVTDLYLLLNVDGEWVVDAER